jgi:hypothetical protein
MARITAFALTAVFASLWAAGTSAESNSKTNSSSPAPKTTTSSATRTAPNPTTPAQRIDNIVNYGAVRTNQNPGAVNRVTPSGTQPMTPNAPSQANRGLRTNAVPAPTNPNARTNTQGRNVNPSGDKAIAAGYDRNQQRYQANQSKPKPAATPSAPTARSWPGPTRPATTPAIKPSTTTAAAPARPASPPPPARNSSYTAASSSSTATSTTNKKK